MSRDIRPLRLLAIFIGVTLWFMLTLFTARNYEAPIMANLSSYSLAFMLIAFNRSYISIRERVCGIEVGFASFGAALLLVSAIVGMPIVSLLA